MGYKDTSLRISHDAWALSTCFKLVCDLLQIHQQAIAMILGVCYKYLLERSMLEICLLGVAKKNSCFIRDLTFWADADLL
jgi:hypothetical protein